MIEYYVASLRHAASEPIGLLFALVLGIVSAVTSACCTLPALGILIGYSAAREEKSRRTAVMSAAYFTGGILLSLMVIGGLAGYFGQVAQASLGGYWKLFAGIVAIAFGLATLKMLPVNLSLAGHVGKSPGSRQLGTTAAGLFMGGGVAACSMPCNPGFFIVLGAAFLQGQIVWATSLLAMFAIGFSLPLGAVLLGISLGKETLRTKTADTAIRLVSGSILLFAGFYLLATY